MSEIRTIETIRAAVTLIDEDGKPVSGTPEEGSIIRVKRAGKPVIPIQEIMQALRAAYPGVTWTFGDSKPIVV
jgi:hypothetical protein